VNNGLEAGPDFWGCEPFGYVGDAPLKAGALERLGYSECGASMFQLTLESVGGSKPSVNIPHSRGTSA